MFIPYLYLCEGTVRVVPLSIRKSLQRKNDYNKSHIFTDKSFSLCPGRVHTFDRLQYRNSIFEHIHNCSIAELPPRVRHILCRWIRYSEVCINLPT